MQSLTLLATAAASSRSALGAPSRGRKIALSRALRRRGDAGGQRQHPEVDAVRRGLGGEGAALDLRELLLGGDGDPRLPLQDVAGEAGGTCPAGDGAAPVLGHATPGARGARRGIGGGCCLSSQRGEAGDEPLEVALEGDQLADQHGDGGLDAGGAESFLLLAGGERRGGRQQVDVSAQRVQRVGVQTVESRGDRVRGSELRVGPVRAMPLGERCAALPIGRHCGEGVQHRRGQLLLGAIERVIGLAGVGQDLRTQHREQIARFRGVREDRGEDLVGIGVAELF